MEQVSAGVIKHNNDAGISHIHEDHQALFNYIEKLTDIASQPKNHQYAITILENFIAFFLEHIIKEEQILQQYLTAKIVADHASLHTNELIYLDKSLATLKANVSTHIIQTIAAELNQEFKNHIARYDNDILQKLMALKK